MANYGRGECAQALSPFRELTAAEPRWLAGERAVWREHCGGLTRLDEEL